MSTMIYTYLLYDWLINVCVIFQRISVQQVPLCRSMVAQTEFEVTETRWTTWSCGVQSIENWSPTINFAVRSAAWSRSKETQWNRCEIDASMTSMCIFLDLQVHLWSYSCFAAWFFMSFRHQYFHIWSARTNASAWTCMNIKHHQTINGLRRSRNLSSSASAVSALGRCSAFR